MSCPHLDLGDEPVSVIQPRHGWTLVGCPCCHLPGYIEPTDTVDGMLCPYCDVQAVIADGAS